MKVKHLLVGLCAVIYGGIFSNSVSATTYSRDVEVKFTFNSEIQIDIDTADIEILDLTPGQQKDSNIVNISVSTNNVAGYTVSATTGNTTYNNTDMTHSDGVNKFTSISTDASESTLSTDNTWGYSTSMDSGTSWANFSGLPIYTDVAKEIAKTDGPSTDLTKFKIHAKASTSQPAGNYRNVITFNVVANVPPRTIEDVIPEKTMQAMSENVCSLVETYDEEGQTQLTDTRDGKKYWVTKLKDENCWMTQNLDLDLESTASNVVALTSENTDLNQYDTDNTKYYNTGYTRDNNTGVITWTPKNSTFTRVDTTSSNWNNGSVSLSNNEEALSFDPGDWYITGARVDNSNSCYFFYDPAACPSLISTTEMDSDGMHRYIGNYYSFGAAIASDNADVNIDSYSNSSLTPQNSICPANWRLPRISSYDYNYESIGTNDFYNLVYYYNNKTTNNDIGLYNAPLYYTRFGYLSSGYQSSAGSQTYYRSATSYSSSSSYYTYAYNSYVRLDSYGNHSDAANIRCVSRANKYHLIFDGNGADSGNTESIYMEKGEKITVPENGYLRNGYVFVGWNTKADGSGTDYPVGSNYVAPRPGGSNSGTLYAKWHQYTITFEANGGEGIMAEQEIPYGSSANLTQNSYTKEGKSFGYWYTLENGEDIGGLRYEDGESFTVPADEEGLGITLYAQWGDTGNHTIHYNANGGEGSMASQTVPYGTRTTLTTNTFTRSGYNFIGWNTSADGAGDSYGNGNYFMAPTSNGKSSTTLYAVWTLPSSPSYAPTGDTTTTGITIQRAYEIAYTAAHKGMYEETANGNGIYERVDSWGDPAEPYKGYDVRFSMQDMTHEICKSVTVIGDQYRALDVRDNKLYYITKLKDGRCWMSQNLDFDIVRDTNKPYTSKDTDLTSYGVKGYDTSHGYSQDADGTIKWVPLRSTIHADNLSWQYDVYNGTSPSSLDIGEWYWTDEWYEPESSGGGWFTDNSGHFSQSMFPISKEHHSFGNYYNWTAAIASNDSSSITGSTMNDPSQDPQNSICPAGWRLPKSGPDDVSISDLYSLYYYYNGARYDNGRQLHEAPFYLVRGGGTYYSSITHVGNYVTYPSSTLDWSDAVSYIGVVGHAMISGTNRLSCQPVRCVAR